MMGNTMGPTAFDGQQTGERILYVVTPHPLTQKLQVTLIAVLSVFFFAVLSAIAGLVPDGVAGALRIAAGVISLAFFGGGIWWTGAVNAKSKTFVTDRRVIRFEPVSPFFVAKRALFWNEALKAKAFSPNLVYRSFNIGIITIEPIAGQENVRVENVWYFEDLANYIDKILYIHKSDPTKIADFPAFVPKPKGARTP